MLDRHKITFRNFYKGVLLPFRQKKLELRGIKQNSPYFLKSWNEHVKDLNIREDVERRDEFEQLIKYMGCVNNFHLANQLQAKAYKQGLLGFKYRNNYVKSNRLSWNIWHTVI